MLYSPCSKKSQSGVVLVISLVMLLILTLIGVTGTQVTSLEEKMAGNSRDKNLAFQAAETALTLAENSLVPPNVLPAFVNAGTGGFYSNATGVDLSDEALKSAAFWRNNPVATSGAIALGNGIAAPQYIIQEMPSVCSNPTIGCPPKPVLPTFKITVRATGGTTSSVVVLQSFFSLNTP